MEPPPILPDNLAEALIKACGGQRFGDRRDKAIVLVLMDTGVRLGELAGMRVGDITQGRSPAPWVMAAAGEGSKIAYSVGGRDHVLVINHDLVICGRAVDCSGPGQSVAP